MKNHPSEEIQRLLKSIFDDCVKEDSAVRERQIRQWRRLKLLWEGFQRIWYSEVAHDWRIFEQTNDEDSNQSYYDKPINVFKAYLESIIAALSIIVPPIKCFPDNADDTLDLATAKAGDKISQLIYRHNNVSLLWLHSLFILCTEGMVACYSYPKSDKKYGTYDEKKYDETEQEVETSTCPICGYSEEKNIIPESNQSTEQPIQNQIQTQNPMQMQQSAPMQTTMQSQLPQNNNNVEPENEDEFMPDNDMEVCSACSNLMNPEIKRDTFIVTRLVGVTKEPKSRICLETYGGLYVKVSNYAKKQEDTTYLIFSRETDYSLVIEKYEHLHDRKEFIKKLRGGNQAGSYNQYDQWGRLSPQYQGEYPTNVVTVNNAWIRPAKFNILPKEDANKLKKLYPDGVKVVFANDEFAEAYNEALDDCWTLTENPLSDYLYYEPTGQGLTSIQEITNDIISLVLQTIEHGIGQTFADPVVLDFKAYAQTEVVPGGIYPAKPKSGKSLGDGFHELRTASLSPEVMPFSNNIQSLAQLVSGALPSLFGGQLEGSETASEYSMSRAQAQQRLQNTWKMFTIWWKTIFGKVVPMYIKEVKDDERDVQRDSDGNFINILIHKADLEGKIGKVELEANENIPLTWAQKKDIVEKLLMNGNPEIIKILSAPENISIIHDALGLVDFYVPGEDDVIKQNDEIKLLLDSSPIETGDPMMPEVPSIEIIPLFDNNAVEFEICRKWIISEAGRQTKLDNEPGYRNVLLHATMHYMEIQKAQQVQQIQQEQGAAPGEKMKETEQEAPIQGEENVNPEQ